MWSGGFHDSRTSPFWNVFFAALSLGCLGGGCSSQVEGPNRAPVADAGSDRSLAIGQSALLDGNASFDPDGDVLGYRWELVHAPAGASAVIQDADAAQARLEPDVTGLWVVRLTVLDGFLDSEPDVVQVHMAGCRSDSECDDGVACTRDSCVEAVCRHEAQDAECDDGHACTADVCDANGNCVYSPDDGLCDDNRSCNGSESCDVLLGCQFGSWAADGIACDEGLGFSGNVCDSSCRSGVCGTQPANAGQACSDGIDCTGPDLCDGAGSCAGINDDSYCLNAGLGSLCRPQCFGGSGCGDPPGGLDLSCTPNPVDLARAVTAQCGVDLGVSGQGACLSCGAKLGHVQLDFTDFDGVGACDPNGWGLVYSAACYDTYFNCNPGTAYRACCADLASTCVDAGGGDYLMRTNKATNCGGGVEEWRLNKVFDFSDLSDLRLCFDLADNNANDNQVVAVWVEDLDSPGPLEIYCQPNGPRDNVDDVAFRQCVDLPAGLNGRARVEVEFVAHSENDNRVMTIDNISLTGWAAVCAADMVSLVIEDFDGCTDPLPDPFGAWTVGGTILCNTSDFNCYDASDRAIADATTGSIERRVDASALDADVELCWHFGDKGNDADKTLLVEYDAGSGFQSAWGYTGNQGPNDGCLQVCVNLTNLDPAVARNPDLGLRFSLGSNSEELVIDHILLRGARNCTAGADLCPVPVHGRCLRDLLGRRAVLIRSLSPRRSSC
jgi:hypothetical protein